MFTLRFDMRAPDFGAPKPALYAAAVDMSAWAENHGCIAAVLCEHHTSEDGYLPSPLILASAIAARTERVLLNLVVILPLYEPVRLAEDLAVLDITSAPPRGVGLIGRPTSVNSKAPTSTDVHRRV